MSNPTSASRNEDVDRIVAELGPDVVRKLHRDYKLTAADCLQAGSPLLAPKYPVSVYDAQRDKDIQQGLEHRYASECHGPTAKPAESFFEVVGDKCTGHL